MNLIDDKFPFPQDAENLSEQHFIFHLNKKSLSNLIMVIVPSCISIVIVLLISSYIKKINLSSDWIAYWGTILGGFISGFITLFGVLIAFQLQKIDSLQSKHGKIKALFAPYINTSFWCYKTLVNVNSYLKNQDPDVSKEISDTLSTFNPLNSIADFKKKEEQLVLEAKILVSSLNPLFKEIETIWPIIRNVFIDGKKQRLNELNSYMSKTYSTIIVLFYMLALSVYSINQLKNI